MAIFGSIAVSAAASTASVALAGGAYMLGSAMSHFLISTALGAALYALTPKTSATGVKGYSIAGNNGSAMDHQVIYGRAKVGGARVYDATTETNNRFLHRILVFAGHEIQSYDEIYLNDELVTLDSNGNVTSPARYVGLVRIKRYFGTTTQTADADLVSETAGLTESTGKWTTDHRLQGLAYLYIRFQYDQDSYPNGVPVVSAVISGKKVLNTTTNVVAWSANAAFCVRDYLVDPDFGMGVDPNLIDITSFNEAAVICGQIVEGERRYHCNGSFTTASKPFDILQGLLSSMGGILWYSAGKWKVKAAAYTTPVMAFTDDDLRSGISISPRHSRRDNFNTVKGTFAGPSTNWQVTDYPEVTDAAFVAEDGGRIEVLDLPLPFTSSELSAQRIARVALFRNRQQITVRTSFSLKALGIEVGDNITITNSRMGWSSKPFEVINWAFGVSEDGAVVINVTLRETSSEAFLGVNGQALVLDNTTLPDPFTVPSVTNLAATNSTAINTDGTSVNSIFVTWSAITTGFTGFYDFEWKLSTASTWNSVDVSDTQFQIVPAISGATYNVRVRAVNALGVRGPFATLNTTGGADTTAPGVPTGFTASAGPERINLRWTNPTAVDFSKVQIRRGTTNVFANSVQIAESTATELIDDNLGAITTRFYWIRALDRTGNASAYAGPVSATTTTRIESGATLPSTGNYEGRLFYNETDGKLYRYYSGAWTAAVPTADLSGTLSTAQFSTTIRPVEVLGALPSTGNFEGRMVYLTTDNKLYRHTGSPLDATGFTTAVATVDLSGQITQTQIADGAITVAKFASGIEPVEILNSLPSTGNFEGRMVYLTTDNKLYRHTGSPLDATGFTSAVPATDITGQVTSSQIADGAINTAKFASGIEPVEILGTLPATGNFEGRMVYLTTDNKLYRHTGSPLDATGFTSAVPATDITGQVTSSQIADGAINTAKFAAGIEPVEILSALPSTGNFAGRVVFLTTDNKLYRHTGSPANASGFTVAVDGADIVANSITAGQIAAGAIGASEIAAQAITASKLAVSDFTNLVPDNQIQEVAAWSNPTRFSIINPTTVSPAPSKGELRYTGTFGLGNQVSDGPRFAVVGGQEYWYNYALARVGGTTYRAWANLQFFDKDGVETGVALGSNTTDRTNGSPLYIQGSITAPATAVEARWRWVVNTNLTDSGVRCWIPTIRLKNGGELIVDGAITATKIAASTITGDRIASNTITAANIAADTITAGQIAAGAISASEVASGAITTEKLAAGAVTADKVAANSITAGQIAADTITASELAANAVTTGKIAAGAVSATEIAAGAITTDKLAVGSINNTIHNSQFYGGLSGWNAEAVSGNTGVMSIRSNTTWTKPGGPVLQVFQPDAGTAGYVDVRTERIGETGNTRFGWPVQGGTYWEASAYISAHRCTVQLRIEWRDITGAVISYTSHSSNIGGLSSSTDPDLWPRLITRGQAPSNAAYATIHLRKLATSSGTNSFMMVYKPLLGETVPNATEAFDWIAGGYTLISGDTILTGSIQAGNIAAATITGDKIAASTITASNIAADTITAGQIAAGAISASEVASGAITATKLAVADFTNLVPDCELSDSSTWPTGSGGEFSLINPSPLTFTSAGHIQRVFVAGTGTRFCVSNQRFTVKAGTEYWWQFQMSRSGGTQIQAFAQIDWFDAAGTSLTNTSIGNTSAITTAGVLTYNGSLTAPASAVTARWRWAVVADNTDGAVRFGSPEVRIKGGGELIVDGGITANNIATNAITSDKITANAITSGKISAGAITADKMAVNSITAANGAIADLAVTTAKINNAAITSAKIGDLQVTTLKIGDNAVTIPVRTSSTGDITCPSAGTVWTTVATGTIIREGYPTRVEVNIRLRSASASNLTQMNVRLLRGGAVLKTFGGRVDENSTGSYYSFVTEDTNTGTGSTVYEIQVQADNEDAIASERFLELLQIKK